MNRRFENVPPYIRRGPEPEPPRDEIMEALSGVQGMYERKDDPTYTSDWDRVKVEFPDLERAWEQVKLARLAFGGLLQEKIDER